MATEISDDDPAKLATCVKTLQIIIRNILKQPDERRYRSMRLQNDSFVLNPDKTKLILPKYSCLWKLRAGLNALDQVEVNTEYLEYAKAAEEEGLMVMQTDEELSYELMGMSSPPALGQESNRSYRLWQHLEAPVAELEVDHARSPTLAEVQHVLGIEHNRKMSVEERMDLRRKKTQLVQMYENALQG